MENQKIKVAYLHNHTIYSEKDAIGTVYEYIKRIEELNAASDKYEIIGMQITEHGHMHTMTEANVSCLDAKLINSPSMEAYHTIDLSVEDTNRYHMVMMAATDEGKRNLFTLATLAGFNKFKGRTKPFPRVDEKMIQTYGKGIIGLSACLGGQIPRLIEEGKYDEAKQKAINYSNWFDEFYLEVQPHTIPDQLVLNKELVRMNHETGIPLVITCDAHYVRKDDKVYHDILKKIDDPSGRMIFRTEAYMMSFEELEAYCIEYDIPLEAIENTGKIIEKCRNVTLKPSNPAGFMPTFPCPPGYTEETYLREISMDHLSRQMIKKQYPNFLERYKQLEYELDVICNQGFAGYFLILWDWFEWCRKNDIIMGKGRGSASASIVCYVLDITSIDPIDNKFIFERFLNPERMEMPDIDSDISKRYRAEGIEYLLTRYGKQYVAQIITFIKYKIRGIIKAAGASLGIDPQEVNSVTRLIPPAIEGIEVSYETLADIRDNPQDYEDLSAKVKNQCVKAMEGIDDLFQRYPQLYMAAQKLNGAVASTGLHAGGVVVSGIPLAGNLPMTKGSDTAVLPLVQVNMADLGFYNLLKIDVLGLRTLDQIYDTMKMTGLDWEWYDNEDWTDEKVYEFLRQGNTTDIFQFSSPAGTRMLRDFKVSTLGDLTAVNAGNRPGPLAKDKDTGISPVDQYKANVDSGQIVSIDPRIDPILADTYGSLW